MVFDFGGRSGRVGGTDIVIDHAGVNSPTEFFAVCKPLVNKEAWGLIANIDWMRGIVPLPRVITY